MGILANIRSVIPSGQVGFVRCQNTDIRMKNIENSVRLLMKEKYGKKRREERVWRDVGEFGPFFVHAQDLPGQ